ncbi:hypothetical protein RI065_06235 [Mycoplasmatota bacterium zrk1]
MKKIWIALQLIVITTTILVLDVIAQDNEVSDREKRRLQMFPEISLKGFFSGEFANRLNDYVEDQFFIRDTLSAVKSWVSYNVFNNPINNNIYLVDGVMFDHVYPIDNIGIDNFLEKISNMQMMFKNNSRVVIIPEKSMYLGNEYLHIDDKDLDTYFSDYSFMYNSLSLEDYYKTDLHLTHKGSYNIYKTLVDNPIEVDFVKVSEDFQGYYSNKAMNLFIKDDMYIASNEIIDNLEICSLSNNSYECRDGVYFNENLLIEDKYSVYLDGNKPITTIINDQVEEGELVIFSDSYGTSIAPFLAQHYHKITVMDLRLMGISYAMEYVSFEAEILYLYGYKTINDSSIST